MTVRSALPTAIIAALCACAPRLRPLAGVPSPRPVPRAEVPEGHHRIVFRWELEDPDLAARGDGAARIAYPDSARLDFFLGGGVGSGAAVLVGDELRLPSRSEDLARQVVPAAPLLWATLGRNALPAATDTTVRVDADTLRADIGAPVAWRLAFVRDTLRRIERVSGGRVQEWVERFPDGHIRYRHEVNRRQLDLYVTRSDEVSAFDPDIWSLP
ncbi:MAG TPA: hypothetical protein VJ867_14635 [Gemmatimonadaceae bacterium]|nr:hypothetical protein [Gemmatimonadaceae bacterium]